MDRVEPLPGKLPGLIGGAYVEDRGLVHEALLKAHAVAIFQINGWIQNHTTYPQIALVWNK